MNIKNTIEHLITEYLKECVLLVGHLPLLENVLNRPISHPRCYCNEHHSLF